MPRHRASIRSACLALAIALLAIAGPCIAAPPDAAQLKRDIAAGIEGISGSKDAALVYGRLDVTPVGDAFRVSVAGLAVQLSSGRVPLGDVGFRISPAPDGNYAVDDVSVPSEIRIGAKDKAVVASLPKIVFNGLWSPGLARFLDIDARIDGLAVGDGNRKGTIGSLILSDVGTDKGGGRWDVVGKLFVGNLQFTDGTGKGFAVDELAVTSGMANVDLETWADLKRRLRAAGRAGQPLDAATMEQLAGIGSTLGAGKASITIAGLSAHDRGWYFALPRATVSLGLSSLDRPLFGITLDLAYDGVRLSIDKQSDDATLAVALAPIRLSSTLALEDLPTGPLIGSVVALMAMADKGSPLIAQLGGVMWGAIAAAHSKFRIGPSEVDSKLVQSKVEGLAQASGAAALGGVAVVQLDLVGLDAATKVAKAALGPNDADLTKALDVLRLASDRHKEADGTMVDHYTFSLSPDGAMKINDKPIDSLFQ